MNNLNHSRPPGWTEGTISDLIDREGIFIDGDWVESKDQDPNGDVRLIQLADIGDGNFRNKSNRYLTSEKATKLKCTFLRQGDVIVARMPDPLGRCCLFPGDSKPCVTAVDVCIIRTGESGIYNKLLMYFINSPNFRSAIESLQSGTTRKRISRKNLAGLFLPVPPLPEQHRIVAKIEELFSDLDSGVEALKKAKAQLKLYRQSVLKAAFEGRLTATWREAHKDELESSPTVQPQGPFGSNGVFPGLPEGWAWASLGQIGEVTGGLTKNANRKTLPIKMPYLRVANVYFRELRLDDVHYIGLKETETGKVLLAKGDLLVVEGNGSIEQIGRVALWDGSISPCVHQNHIIKVRFNPVEVAKYVLYWLCSAAGREYVTQVASSTTGLHTLSISKVAKLPIPISPLAEQARVVEEIERHFSIIDDQERAIENSLKKSDRLRQAIFKRAFAGKLVEQDPEDEPAAALLERIKGERAGHTAAKKPGRRPAQRDLNYG